MRAHRDGRRGESSPAEAILVPLQAAACPWATAELDASVDALPDVMEDASPELRHRPDAGVGKLAVPVPDVREPDAQSLPPERLVRLASRCLVHRTRSGMRNNHARRRRLRAQRCSWGRWFRGYRSRWRTAVTEIGAAAWAAGGVATGGVTGRAGTGIVGDAAAEAGG